MARPRTTWQDVAEALGVDTRRLADFKRYESAPATPSVAAWRKWLATREGAGAQPAGDDGEDAEAGPSTAALKAEKLGEEVRKLRIVNDGREKRLKEQWRLIGVDAAGAILRRARGGLMGLLPARVAAAAVGKSSAEVELIVRREVEAVLAEALKTDEEGTP